MPMNSRWHRGYFVFVLDRSSSFLPGIFLCLKPYNLTVSPTNDLRGGERTNDLRGGERRWRGPTTSEVANEVANGQTNDLRGGERGLANVTSDPGDSYV